MEKSTISNGLPKRFTFSLALFHKSVFFGFISMLTSFSLHFPIFKAPSDLVRKSSKTNVQSKFLHLSSVFLFHIYAWEQFMYKVSYFNCKSCHSMHENTAQFNVLLFFSSFQFNFRHCTAGSFCTTVIHACFTLGLCSVIHVKLNHVVSRAGTFQVDHIIFKKMLYIISEI